MLSTKDLLFLALLLARPDGMYPSDFRRYGVVGFFSRDPYARLAWLVDQGLAYEQYNPLSQRTKHFITPAGALAHFHATAV